MEERFPFLKLNDNANDFGSAKNNEATQKTKTIKKPAELLKEGTRVLVVGAPGAGKSVLVKYLALQILSLDEYHDRLPIFIELKSISQDKFKKLEENFENLLVENIVNKALGLDENRDLIHNRLKESLKIGKVNIFLDGLDEIKAEPFFNKLCESISSFLKVINPSNNLIISSRPYAVETVFHSIKEIEIAPLNSNQIKQFIHCYYPEESTTLIKQLEKREQKELTRVPLLLSILISLYRKNQVVDNRLDLYKLIINYLVTVIDKEKNVARNFNIIDLDGVLKLKLLKELAFNKIFDENVQNTQNFAGIFTFTDNQILEIAKTFYQNDLEKAVLLTKDIKSLGIIREIASQTYAFTHPTIHEYLAAIVLSEQNNSEDLICQTYFNEVLVQLEVLPMAIGLSKKPSNIHRKLRNLPESLDYTNFRLRIRSFIYLIQTKDSSLLEELKEICNQLIELIQGKNIPQTSYEENIFYSFSLYDTFYLNIITEVLVKLLSNSYWHTRLSTAKAFGMLKFESSVKYLIPLLSDSDTYVRQSVVQALGQISSNNIDYLIPALSDPDGHVRWNAAEALGQKENDKAVEALFDALSDSEPLVVTFAIEALSNIGTTKATNALIKALSHQKISVRRSIPSILAQIGGEKVVTALSLALFDSDPVVRSKAAEALAIISTQEAIDILLNASSNSDIKIQHSAIEALATLGNSDAINSLISALSNSEDYVRSGAAFTLGNIGIKKAVDPLINSLLDKDSEVYYRTAEALGKIGDPKAVAPLVKALTHFDGGLKSGAAAKALGKISDPKAVDPLINILPDNHWYTSEIVAEALGKIGDPKAIDPLIDTLSSSDFNSRLRSKSAEALGKLGSDKAINPLEKALSDSESSVRSNAAKALGLIISYENLEHLINALFDRGLKVSFCAANSLNQIKERTPLKQFSQLLFKAANSQHNNTRKKVAETAGYYTTDEYLFTLLKYLSNNDPDKEVKQIAQEALSKYNNKLDLFR